MSFPTAAECTAVSNDANSTESWTWLRNLIRSEILEARAAGKYEAEVTVNPNRIKRPMLAANTIRSELESRGFTVYFENHAPINYFMIVSWPQ